MDGSTRTFISRAALNPFLFRFCTAAGGRLVQCLTASVATYWLFDVDEGVAQPVC